MNSIIHTPILQAMELFVDSNVDIGVEANDTCFVDEETCFLLSIIIRLIMGCCCSRVLMGVAIWFPFIIGLPFGRYSLNYD
jgi:hypothetical protein